jgi:hypothetical protein
MISEGVSLINRSLKSLVLPAVVVATALSVVALISLDMIK